MIDTSTDSSIVAARAGDRCAARYSHSRASHSGILFAHIDDVLRETGIAIQDLTIIGTGTGPGSFTGIRIAVTTARMIAQILSIPLVGIHSQELYAAGLIKDSTAGVKEGDLVLSAFDAKKTRIFGGLYRAKGGFPETVLAAGDYYPIELAAHSSANLIGCGNGSALCADACESKGVTLRTIENYLPDAKAMSEIFIERYSRNPETYADYEKTLPFYARKSDAEVLHLQKITKQ
jgi:tRNA threonylcarbamoyl adenosine modification protein YeaZ